MQVLPHILCGLDNDLAQLAIEYVNSVVMYLVTFL